MPAIAGTTEFRKNGTMILTGLFTRRCATTLFPLLLFSMGCGPENKLGRLPVAGMVRLDGEPLDRGTILFAPDRLNSAKPGGVSSGAQIEDGKYSIAEHKGLTPGSYAARVYSSDEEAELVEPQVPGPGIKTVRERIPARYNLRTELKLEIDGSEKKVVFDVEMDSR